MKCDNCNKNATVHLTEIKGGKKIEKHLCEQCAAQNEGLPVKSHMPINELLTNFVMSHSGMQQKETALQCEHCEMSWADFRQNGLLGCPNGAVDPDEVARLQYHDPARAVVDYAALSDDVLTVIARNREATALYAWELYFHNPKLRQWLHRINIPTLLLWGASDRFITPGYYGAAYRDAIPGAQLEIIERAGHFPHIEQPEAFVERVRAFLDEKRKT